MFDTYGHLVLCNSSFKKLNPDLAWKTKPGKSYDGVVRNHVANGPIFEAVGREESHPRERSAIHHIPRNDCMRSQRHDGRWLMLRKQRLLDGSTFLVNTDLTILMERKWAFEIKKARAQHANRVKFQFLAK